MPSAGLTAPAVVYLLADHLDTSLAAGEDLLKSTLRWNAGDSRSESLNGARREEREAIEAVRTLEMVLIARVLKSRESAQELAKLDSRFKLIARLYASGTDVVAGASSEFTDETSRAFDAGDGVTAFLRSRGFIAEDAAAPLEAANLPINEQFLVAGRMQLGPLLDLVAMFLDTLETHYELYEEPRRSARAENTPTTTGTAIQ